MFGPRWVLAIPLVALVPASLLMARKAVWLLIVALVFILGPLTGFSMPWRTYAAPQESAMQIRVLSCNGHYNKLDVLALSRLIEQTQPDIMALQGWLGKNNAIMSEKKLHTRRDGELYLASRFPLQKVEAASDRIFRGGHGALARYELELQGKTIHFLNLHLASPRQGLKAVAYQPRSAPDLIEFNSDLRRDQARLVMNWIERLDGPLLIAGDFNTPPESTIYEEHWSSFHNGFEEAGFVWSHTYISRWSAVRIDHQLAGPGWRCRKCWVGPEVGSPHRPVIADWIWKDAFD